MKKLTNKQMVTFLNETASLKKKKLPLKMSFAIRHNTKILTECYPAYEETLKELTNPPITEDKAKQIDDLFLEEIEVSIKTVPMKIIELTDTADYDTLTLGELEGLEVMIEEDGDNGDGIH